MSLFTSKFDLRSFSPNNTYKYTPRQLDESELADLRQMSQDLSFESYLKGLEQKKTSSNPVSYADSWYQRMVQDSIALNVLDVPQILEVDQNLNTTGPVRSMNLKNNAETFLNRFQSRNNPREEELSKIAEGLGFKNVGMLAYDQYSNEFRYGTLGFHGASLTSNMDGSQFELMYTNQNTQWAKTLHNFNMNMFESSPAFQPIKETAWKLKESDQTKEAFYIHTDGTIVTKGSLNLPNLSEAEKLEPVTPDTIVGKNEDGSPILAKDSIPLKTIDEGLIALRRNDLEESFYNYNSGTVNNFGRLARVGDFGQADQTVMGVIDTSNIPIVDFVRSLSTPGKTNADYIAKNLSTPIDGKKLVETIRTRDPLWYQDMLEQGIDMEKLAAMPTAGLFRAYVNGTYQRNAIARSLRSIEAADGWWWDKFYKGREMLYSTLVAGDAVGQVGLTVLSLGTNLVVAGTLTAARTVPTAVATSAAKVAAVRAGVASNVSFGVKFAQGLQSVVRWLPANAPSTLVEMGLKRLPSLENGINSLHWSGQWASRGTLWTSAQATEGFIEEGVTDVVNQGYELSLGLRTDYSYSQTLMSAWQGALMEPVLGGVLMGPMIAVGYTGQTLGRASLKGTTRWFNLDQGRVAEFNFYLSALNGNFDNLSPIEQQIRQETIVRALVMEEALGPISTGAFTKAESAFARFAQMGLNLRSQFGNLTQGNFVNASLILSDVVTKWQTDWDSGNLDVANRLEAARDLGLITIETDTDGNDKIKLTEDSTELFLNFIVTGAFGEKGSTARKAFIDREFKTRLREKILNENKDLQTELDATKEQIDANPAEPKFKQQLLDIYTRLDQKVKEFVEDPAKSKEKAELMETIVKKTTSALELFPSNSTKQEEETFTQATRDTLEMSDARLETALEPIGKIVADTKTKPAPKPATSTRSKDTNAVKGFQDSERKLKSALKNKNLKDIANALFKFNKRLSIYGNTEVSENLQQLVEEAKQIVKEAGLDIVDPTGQTYAEGWVEVEPIQVLPSDGKDTRTRVVDVVVPIIRDKNGVIIQRGQVIIREAASTITEVTDTAIDTTTVATETTTPLTKDQKQQQVAGGQIAVNLNIAVKNGTISSLEFEMIKKRLSQIKTTEDAGNFRQWAISHKNRNIGITIAGELGINEAWNRTDNASPEIMANIVLDTLNNLNKDKTEVSVTPVTSETISTSTKTDSEAAIDLIVEELRSTDLDLNAVKPFLTEFASKPGFTIDMLEGVLECLSQTKTNEEKVQQIRKLGCGKD